MKYMIIWMNAVWNKRKVMKWCKYEVQWWMRRIINKKTEIDSIWKGTQKETWFLWMEGRFFFFYLFWLITKRKSEIKNNPGKYMRLYFLNKIYSKSIFVYKNNEIATSVPYQKSKHTGNLWANLPGHRKIRIMD